jgi:hypothetical protein
VDREAVHDFLASRRARITPEQAGMPTYGEKRRVPRLRRRGGRSDGFAAQWARHDVRLHRTARKRLGSRVVGETS